jgi:pimeloyl-ACP methyl ester carboxylesterase/DNA-binding CsgD family transcriptional regulator
MSRYPRFGGAGAGRFVPTRGRVQQSIRYLKTADGVRLAWASCGDGPATLVKAANWLTHLNYDLDSPVWKHWIDFFSRHFRLIRYDERGCGMTDWEVSDLSMPRWTADLEEVVEVSDPGDSFVLFGCSHGTAAAMEFAARHPQRVSHLILYGGYAVGWAHREDPGGLARYRAITELVRTGWGHDNPVFRQLFTSRFVPGARPEQLEWFNELCRRTTSPAMAARLLVARGELDVRGVLPRVCVPTLVLHARGDEVVPLSMGKMLAAEIPNAVFVELDSLNHVLLEDEPAWTRFKEAVLQFTERAPDVADPRLAALSQREQEILGALVAGKSNAEIGATLFISDKTVRNALTRIFAKLGVHTRTQAAVLARDRGWNLAGPTRRPTHRS